MVGAGRRLRARGPRLARRVALVSGLAALALALVLGVLRTAYDGRVYPAVHVGGLDLGGLSREEARAALQGRADALEQGTVTFTHAGQSWAPSLRELGARFEVGVSLERAYDLGRESSASDRLRTMSSLARRDQGIPLAMTFDHAVIGGWFDRVDEELGLPPHDAYLNVAAGSVTIVPEVEGTIVDRPVATAAVLDGLRHLRSVAAPLPVVEKVALVRAGDLTPARDRLATALAQPVRVSFGQGSWTLAPSDLGAFVVQRVDPAKRGAEAHSIALDTPKLAAWLDERIAPSVNRDPTDATVGWNEGLVSVETSQDGLRLRAAELAANVERSLFGDHAPLQLPVDVIRPTVDSNNLGALGVTTPLGRGDSNYDGSKAGRATNVEVGASRMNGTLIPPGGEFSFNNAIGVINEENGFVEAQVIDGERIGKDIGGGICQVSTTVFRAALLAGMPISEWWPHKYRIPFYEYDGWAPGLDASILQPTEDPSTWGDFRFLNPTDSWLLVESWTTGSIVVVNIYGADLGYQVEMEGPVFGKIIPIDPDLEVVDATLDPGTIDHTEAPQEGGEVIHHRTVYGADGAVLREDQWYTLFYSRGNVWQVSPDMQCQSPAGGCYTGGE